MKYVLLLSVLLVGCIQPPAVLVQPPVKKVTPLPPTPIQQPIKEVEVQLDDTIVANLFRYLGASNTVTLAEPLLISQKDTSIQIPAGANLTYKLTAQGGTITFNNPKPVVTVIDWGVKFHPTLDRVVITSPNKGEAVVTEFGKEITKKFVLQWQLEPETAVEAPKSPFLDQPNENTTETPPKPLEGTKNDLNELDEVWFFGDPRTCPPCKDALKALDEYQRDHALPFKLVVNPKGKSNPTDSTPCFMWGKKQRNPTGDTSKDWKLNGWYGVDYLIKEFNRTHKKLTTKTAAPRCTIGFGPEWVEQRYGYTTIGHLVNDHHLKYDWVKQYAGSRTALNQIHGWCHLREMRF